MRGWRGKIKWRRISWGEIKSEGTRTQRILRMRTQPFLHPLKNQRGRKSLQTSVRLRVSAARGKAGRAGKVNPQNTFELAIRPGAARFRRAEQRDERLAERGGGMHPAGVIRHHESAEAHPFEHFRQ